MSVFLSGGHSYFVLPSSDPFHVMLAHLLAKMLAIFGTRIQYRKDPHCGVHKLQAMTQVFKSCVVQCRKCDSNSCSPTRMQ